MVDTSLKVS